MRKRVGLKAGCLLGMAAAAAALWAARDYAQWRSLGAGGLPANVRGWLTMTRLRLRAVDGIDVSPIVTSSADDWRGWTTVRPRVGAKPRVSPYPVPHRQLTQLPGEVVREALRQAFDGAVAEHATEVEYALSHFEKRHPAIRRRSGAMPPSYGEIAHIHPSDHSMHMILGPADAVAAIQAGWGERHGLAGIALSLPVNYVMIYAPRDADDLAAIKQLLEAAIRFAFRAQSAAALAQNLTSTETGSTDRRTIDKPPAMRLLPFIAR